MLKGLPPVNTENTKFKVAFDNLVQEYKIDGMKIRYTDNKNCTRLAIDVPIIIAQEVKEKAALKNITIKKYVNAAILEKIKRDRQYD